VISVFKRFNNKLLKWFSNRSNAIVVVGIASGSLKHNHLHFTLCLKSRPQCCSIPEDLGHKAHGKQHETLPNGKTVNACSRICFEKSWSEHVINLQKTISDFIPKGKWHHNFCHGCTACARHMMEMIMKAILNKWFMFIEGTLCVDTKATALCVNWQNW